MVVAPGFIDIQDQSGGQLLLGDGRQLGKITQGVTTGILGEGSTPAPLNPANLPPEATRSACGVSREPHGFDAWLSAMEAHRHLAERRVVRRRGHDSRNTDGRADGRRHRRDARLDARRRAPRDGRRRVRHGERADLPAGHVRDDGRADRRMRRRWRRTAASTSRTCGPRPTICSRRSTRSIRIAREGGVPVEIYHLKAAGTRNWSKEARDDREDRLGARRGCRRAGEHVPVHGRRDRPHVVPPAVVLRRRQAVRQPRERGRFAPRSTRKSRIRRASGRTCASSRVPRAC